MTMTTNVAQLRIEREVREAEEALNEALLRQSQLFTSMLAARRDIGTPVLTGQDALLRLSKSQQSLLTAGGDLARVHGRLAEIGAEITGTLADNFCPPKSAGLNDDLVVHAVA